MKKIVAFFITVILLFALTVLESEGITSALLYQNKSEKLISALEKENFTYASNFLSFYGKSDIKAARSKWAQDMQACGIEFKKYAAISCGVMTVLRRPMRLPCLKTAKKFLSALLSRAMGCPFPVYPTTMV